jgi:hypothetical protein
MSIKRVTTRAIDDGQVTAEKLAPGAPTWTSTATGGVFGVQQSGIELGTGTVSNFGCFVDFHSSATPKDFECRIVRDGGDNGDFSIINTGTGEIAISNTGAGAITLSTSNAERMRITASGNVGVGTASPSYSFDVAGSGYPLARVSGTFSNSFGTYSSLVFGAWSGTNTGAQTGFIQNSSTPSQSFYHITPWGGTEGFNFKLSSSGRVGISVSGEPSSTLQVGGTVTATAFSGPLTGNVTGSASTVNNGAVTAAKLDNVGQGAGNPPIYGARAWVNFNGTGTVAIRTSGNVSSITDNGTGTYTVNFTTAMPDTNYSVNVTARRIDANNANFSAVLKGTTSANTNYPLSTTSCEVICGTPSNNAFVDSDVVCVSVFR